MSPASRPITGRSTSSCGCGKWNRNYVGTHFGGSLFAMTDPFWMLGLLHILP